MLPVAPRLLGWLCAAGDAVVVKIGASAGRILVTSYGPAAALSAPEDAVALMRIDAPRRRAAPG